MTTKEMADIMLAYDRGEEIERRKSKECKWEIVIHPTWDWSRIAYRVNPKPTLRPYKNAAEFLQAQTRHGMYIRPKISTSRYELPIGIDDELVVFAMPTDSHKIYPVCYHYDNLLEDKVWQDGTPCGVEE